MNQFFGLLATLFFLLQLPSFAQDWPTFRRDAGRTGFVNAELDPGRLEPQWTWKSKLPPEPAWDGPARWDAYAELKDLPAMRQYDACFHPVSDGSTVYFGSSSQDTLYALDQTSGKPKWFFVAGGPIRIAPTLYRDFVLFGSDDGYAYCLQKSDGKLAWKFNPSAQAKAEQRRVINNDRLISFYPVRTGIVVRDNVAYFAASFLPWRESYLCGIDVESGKIETSKPHFVTRHENATLEGPILIAEGRLIVPQGRIAPLLFDRSNGGKLGNLPGGGGVTIVLTEKGNLARAEGGRASRAGQLGVFKGKERVASFPRGRSLVVRENAFYVIDGEKIFAASRKANEILWQRDFEEPLEIIVVGQNVVVGGKDRVAIFQAKNGKKVWEHSLSGRVFGLAYAGDRLLASTDAGEVVAFSGTAKQAWKESPTALENVRDLLPVPEMPKATGDQLLHRWIFHRSSMRSPQGNKIQQDKLSGVRVQDHAGKTELKLAGTVQSIAIGNSALVEGIETKTGMFPIDKGDKTLRPTREISAGAWVRVDQPATWGGIVGCIQDDGATEHGWLLGYNANNFSFAVAGGKVGLTYLKAKQGFQKGHWYHVVGTYDGKEIKLYVDGELSATSQAESGPINYSNNCFSTVGAYKDQNESYPLNGALHEVQVYAKALTATRIRQQFNRLKSEFKTSEAVFNNEQAPEQPADTFLAWGPYTKFIQQGAVEIRYGTRRNCPTVVQLETSAGIRKISSNPSVSEHRIIVDKLPYKRTVPFRILDGLAEDAKPSRQYEIDTHFDWAPFQVTAGKPLPILSKATNPRGMAFVFGRENAELAKRMSQESQFTVVLFCENDALAEELRKNWVNDPGVAYGKRISVLVQAKNELPAGSAVLVVPPRNSPPTDGHLYRRLVRPAGGILTDGQKVLWERKKVAGAGEWTHMYGLPDNSAYGGEELAEASNRGELVVNWIGRPGPRYKTDRGNRKPSPLATAGRLYLQGQQRLIALDSYSGNILWSIEAPTAIRLNIPRDSSNWCADETGVFIAAEDRAWFLNGKTGDLETQFSLPPASLAASKLENPGWGYIARHQDLLLGTVVRDDAIARKWWGKTKWYDSTSGTDTHVVAGNALFAIDLKTKKPTWNYNGLVLHPTITILDNKIYFVEDKTPGHLADQPARIPLDKNQSHELVCLDLENGKQLFRNPLDSFQGKIASLYLSGGGNPKLKSLVMVASETSRSEFTVSNFNPLNGKPNWKRAVKWEANHHGKHISRPAIENDILYVRPEVMKLADGSTIHRGFPSGHGCSSYTLAKNGLFSRLGETTWWDVRNKKVNRFSRVRTDCWISAIPAQGMLLSAEGGGGCSCGSWLETSMGFLPRKIDQTFPELETPIQK